MALQPIQVIQAEEYSAPTMQLFNSVLQSARETSESVQRQNQFRAQALQQVNNQLQQRIGNIEVQFMRNLAQLQLQNARLDFQQKENQLNRDQSDRQFTQQFIETIRANKINEGIRQDQVDNTEAYQDSLIKNQEEQIDQGWLRLGLSGDDPNIDALSDLNKVVAKKIEDGLISGSNVRVAPGPDGTPAIMVNGQPMNKNEFLEMTTKNKQIKDWTADEIRFVGTDAKKDTKYNTPVDVTSLTPNNLESRLSAYRNLDGKIVLDGHTYRNLLNLAATDVQLGNKLRELSVSGQLTYQRPGDNSLSVVTQKDMSQFKSLFNMQVDVEKNLLNFWKDEKDLKVPFIKPDQTLAEAGNNLRTTLKEKGVNASERNKIMDQYNRVVDAIINNHTEYSLKDTKIGNMKDIFIYNEKGDLKDININGGNQSTKENTDPFKDF